MRQLIRNTNIDFLSKTRLAIIISSVFLIVSIGSLLFRGINFGIDFTGGTLVEIAMKDAANVDEIRNDLASNGVEDAVVQYFGSSHEVLIRLPADPSKTSAESSSQVVDVLRAAQQEQLLDTENTVSAQQCSSNGDIRDCAVQMQRVEFVGPQVGDELKNQGVLAMVFALIGILIYVSFRFEWKFALGSVAALVHDVLITLGIFALLQIEFSLPVLAALLAVIGYSLNDTIVVFDRIRENFRKMRKGTSADVINNSINQTLPRTVLTSLTTLFVVLSLLIFGGSVISGFAVALLIGVLVGTYSSIFVASSSIFRLGVKREDLMPVEKEGVEIDSMP